jgi:hypothetical protein
MPEEERVVLVNHSERYHEPAYQCGEILHTVCGLNSLNHDMAFHPRDNVPNAKPCKNCFNEQHCELCGEKMPGLRWIVVDDTVYHACEICVGDLG